jgi:hypothetical protein
LYNNEQGTVVEYIEASTRYRIEVDSDPEIGPATRIIIKLENMEVLSVAQTPNRAPLVMLCGALSFYGQHMTADSGGVLYSIGASTSKLAAGPRGVRI